MGTVAALENSVLKLHGIAKSDCFNRTCKSAFRMETKLLKMESMHNCGRKYYSNYAIDI
jgi:hypothetical protein